LTSPLIPLPRKIRGLRQKRGKGKFLEMPITKRLLNYLTILLKVHI